MSVQERIVIVGSEKEKWTKQKAVIARQVIASLIDSHPNAIYGSGECPYGGIDIWTREIVHDKNKSFKPFPPKKNKWYYYRKRNIEMAEWATVVVNIEPKGVRSGGTWTANYAHKLGKIVMEVEI